MERSFDKNKSRNKEFEVGDLVLKWDHPHDEKGKHTKFQHMWSDVDRPISNCRKSRALDIQVTGFIGVGRESTCQWFGSQALFYLMHLRSFVHK